MTRACVFLFLFAACSITETGNPPVLEGPELDRARVNGMSLFGGSVTVLGEPGAVTPPVGVVRATNLDTSAAFEDWVVGDDGAFGGRIGGDPGQVLRLQTVDGDARGVPIDLDVTSFAPVPGAPSCLDIDLDLRVDERAELRIESSCADAVSLTASFRIGAFDVEPSELVVPPGEVTVFTINRTGDAEDVLLLRSADGRHAVTLHR